MSSTPLELTPSSASTATLKPSNTHTSTTPTTDSKPDLNALSPASTLTMPAPPQFRPRGHSTSTLPPNNPSDATLALSRVTSAPALPPSSSSFLIDDRPTSSFRARSRSPGKIDGSMWGRKGTETPPADSVPSTWWGGGELIPRPWRDPPKRKKTVPAEQTDGWLHTRERVALAAASVLGTTGDIAHEVLTISIEFLDFVPVPGLRTAALTLLNIWDNLQHVDMNRLACLRLTERCADILLAVRQEIRDAGDYVGEELAGPIAKLVESFTQVCTFLLKQIHRPFLKRYLKRDEILRDIAICDTGLGDALGMFSLSIQIRILKQVQAAERKRQADMQSLIGIMASRGLMPTIQAPSNALQLTENDSVDDLALTGLPSSTTPTPTIGPSPITPSTITPSTITPSTSTNTNTALSLPSPSHLPPSEVLPTLLTLHGRQNELDAAHDTADLRALMRAALGTSSDAEMIGVLQVGREEMPEAVKTLQRALERVVEREGEGVGVGVGGVGGSGAGIVSVKTVEGGAVGEGMLKRSKTIVSVESLESWSSSSGSAEGRVRDTLDREFMEGGIDALRRMSKGGSEALTLPSWTITRYEVDREEQIGVGFFSDVYRGTWRGRSVAIKVLAPSTPRGLFVREVGVWRGLRCRYVLELFGASSASGDPPWFFVSPFMGNGCLSEFLRRWEGGGGGRKSGEVARRNGGKAKGKAREWDGDLLRIMYEIAKGMEYLHSQGVLHGDLKAANVLVDDKLHCVISDFGQSEMKSEAYRISGTPPPHGTLRWQAPELMAGQGRLTTEMDVYAYAITCSEILTMGRMPWPLMDDDAVRHFVLKENTRPPIPQTRFTTPGLQELLRVCWHRDPFVRPLFSKVVRDVKVLRRSGTMIVGGNGNNGGEEGSSSPYVPAWVEIEERERVGRPSPDMHPIALPVGTPPRDGMLGTSPDGASHMTARETSQSAKGVGPLLTWKREDTVATSRVKMPEPVLYTPSASVSNSRASSLFAEMETQSSSGRSEEGVTLVDWEGYDSPPPANERIAEVRNERRYRLLMVHEFHPSLTLPLWSPSPVGLGAVGYLSKPSGSFVTLFNSFDPSKTSDGVARGMPSVYGYGKVTPGNQRQDKRNAAQRGFDAITGLLTFKSKGDGTVSQNVSRRYSFPLRAGHKKAYLCTETTMYRYMDSLEAPKKWFKSNVDNIMESYGAMHRIQKEDLFLVIGTLDAPDYALFVSHNHADGQAHFNVFSGPKVGQPWGTFTTDTEFPSELGGPLYHEPAPSNPLSASKVSTNGGPWDTVLVARLRFKPDVLEPTSL